MPCNPADGSPSATRRCVRPPARRSASARSCRPRLPGATRPILEVVFHAFSWVEGTAFGDLGKALKAASGDIYDAFPVESSPDPLSHVNGDGISHRGVPGTRRAWDRPPVGERLQALALPWASGDALTRLGSLMLRRPAPWLPPPTVPATVSGVPRPVPSSLASKPSARRVWATTTCPSVLWPRVCGRPRLDREIEGPTPKSSVS